MRPDTSHRPSSSASLGALFVALAVAAFGVWYLAFRTPAAHDPNAKPRPVVPTGTATGEEEHRVRVFEQANPSVVNVDTLRFQRGHDFNLQERRQGTGTGFVWDAEGRVVTNFHVVRDALAQDDDGTVTFVTGATVRVTMHDGTKYDTRLVGLAPHADLAVLQLLNVPAAAGLRPIPVGSSHDLKVGQTVYAIGNPFGQSGSFTEGIVSALNREIASPTDEPIAGVIQTDAAINPGNSGGPLLDRDGRLIGVNTAITSPSGGSVGIGYAIPVDAVNRVVPELIATGRTARPSLGITPVAERDARLLGVAKGVLVGEVKPDGPAAKAGVLGFRRDPRTGRQQAGDVIVAVGGKDVAGLADYGRALGGLMVGETVTVTVRRGGRTVDVTLTLEGI